MRIKTIGSSVLGIIFEILFTVFIMAVFFIISSLITLARVWVFGI